MGEVVTRDGFVFCDVLSLASSDDIAGLTPNP
jgi:hypothetical protein